MQQIWIDGNQINFENGKLTLKELKLIFDKLPFEVRFISATGKLEFISNPLSSDYKINERIHSSLDFTNLPSTFDILERFRHGKLDKFERALKVNDQYFNLILIAIRDDQQRYLGCLQLTQNITEIISKFKFGGFIESSHPEFNNDHQNHFHYTDQSKENYRQAIENDLIDLNTDEDNDAISGASEL